MTITSPVVHQRYIRLRNLASSPNAPGRLPISANSVWRLVREGQFPKPIKLSPGVTAWLIEDIEAWEEQKIGGAI
jgi:prophage regulatory protein